MTKFSFHIISILLLSFVFVFNVNAQSGIDKKSKRLFKKGIDKFRDHNYLKSIDYFDKVIKRRPKFIKPYLYKASAYFELKQYKKSEEEYKKVLKIDSSYNSDINYSLALVLEKQKEYEDALKYYRVFIKESRKNAKLESKAKLKIRNLPFIISALKNPVEFEPIALDSTINSGFSEYLPTLTGDNSEMIFTRRINRQEDLYSSKFVDGKWQKATPITELNTLANESVQTISSDGKILIFTICERGRTIGSCDLFISKKEKNHWSTPHNLGARINSPYWDSQPSISSDNKTLYFSSNRPGGIGGKDIWVSHFINQKWSKPICLDTTINTKSDEQTPFIHADNATLYFSSNGHPGMGGSDLFFSKLINGKWSKAVNLGYPINTEYDEGALFVSLDGKSSYFSADRNSKKNKNLDIYYFELPVFIKPNSVTYVKGFVYDKASKIPLKASIQLSDNNTGKFIQSIEADSFFIALPAGVDYNFTVQKDGYVFYSDRFVLDTSNSVNNPIVLNIALEKIPDNTAKTESNPIVLNNLFFKTNSSELDLSKSGIELNKLLLLLRNNKELHIQINGHTDNSGSTNYNRKLSIQRAKSVYDYLISQGIGSSRLKYQGYGETKPIVPNNTPENRSKNRRVEFVIYSARG